MTSSKSLFAVFASALGLVLVGAVGIIYFNKNSDTGTDATKEQVTPPTDASSASGSTGASSEASAYKDGTYTATGSYRTPGSTEEVTVTLTLENGIVTDVSASATPQAPESRRFQGLFFANYKQYVIGKSIDSLSLSQVSGSSLTSGGFNAAVADIKAQAQG